MHMSFFTKKVSSKSTIRKKVPPRLSNVDLQALFRRLDVSGDGELSYAEFRNIITKLNLQTATVVDSLNDIFSSANTEGKTVAGGTLDIKEFIKAYDILYNRLLTDRQGKDADPTSNWVRATRYGYFGKDEEANKKYIFEVYSGNLSNIATKTTYELPDIRHENEITGMKIDTSETASQTISLEEYTIETINRLILEDGERNTKYGARIMWWVDICCKKTKDSEVSTIMKAFGIPSEVRDSMSVLGDTRWWFGSGEVICESIGKSIAPNAYLGKAAVLSLFVQALSLHNKPMVDRDPVWLRKIPLDIGRYISSRLSLFYNMSRVRCTEREKLSHLVEDEVNSLLDYKLEDRKVNEVEKPAGNRKDGGMSSGHQSQLPLPRRHISEGDAFLLSNADLKKRKPSWETNNVSLHLQDQGYGPIALISVRTMDSDLIGNQWSMEQHSRAGVVGRMMHGIWLKLLEVGVTDEQQSKSNTS